MSATHHFVRTVVPDDRLEDLWLKLADFDPAGTDEGSLASGNLELLIYFPNRVSAEACAEALAEFSATVEQEKTSDWNATWQSTWQPLTIGQRFWIAPEGHHDKPPPGRFSLRFHAGTAFGNGDHPTTQLCLELMEKLVNPGEIFLDLGCGSGLLCEAAALLGARAVGCDLDREAVSEALGRGSTVFQGSVDAVARVDVVVANLAPGTLAELRPEIDRVAGRVVIVSGVLAEQRDTLAGASIIVEREGWLAAAFVSRSSSAGLRDSSSSAQERRPSRRTAST